MRKRANAWQLPLSDFHIRGVETSIDLYRTILETDEFKNGDLSTDFLKRFGILDRLKQDIQQRKQHAKDASLAAATLHSEFMKSRIIQGDKDYTWGNDD